MSADEYRWYKQHEHMDGFNSTRGVIIWYGTKLQQVWSGCWRFFQTRIKRLGVCRGIKQRLRRRETYHRTKRFGSSAGRLLRRN
ncbi:hypothetical protein AOLI_G00316750 [Acnodon oligacanthus]